MKFLAEQEMMTFQFLKVTQCKALVTMTSMEARAMTRLLVEVVTIISSEVQAMTCLMAKMETMSLKEELEMTS